MVYIKPGVVCIDVQNIKSHYLVSDVIITFFKHFIDLIYEKKVFI